MSRAAVMSVLGRGLCLPQAGPEAERFGDCSLDASLLPPLTRRRTSLATRMAVSAADRACRDAGDGRDMPAVFVSAIGEMQVTDKLCQAIAGQAYPLSPTQFHNSVHNTAAGYWSIAVDTMQPMQAMAALADGFALGLVEAACQITAGADRLLLVCYDEAMPDQLLPDYSWQPCALALVLGQPRDDRPRLALPYRDAAPAAQAQAFAVHNPAVQGLALLERIQDGRPGRHRVQLGPGAPAWFTELVLP